MGFDIKIVKHVLKLRNKDKDRLAEEDSLIDLYPISFRGSNRIVVALKFAGNIKLRYSINSVYPSIYCNWNNYHLLAIISNILNYL